MSDPVTNVGDVEDVLSSIRRLVSETSSDARPEDDSETDGAAPEAEAATTADDAKADTPESDALILTSALRIKDPQTPEPANTPSELDSLRKAVSGGFDDTDAAEDIADDTTKLDLPESRLHLASFEDVEDTAEEEVAPTSWSGKPPEDYYEDEVEEDAVHEDAAAGDDDETWVFKKPEIAAEDDLPEDEADAEEDELDTAAQEVEEELSQDDSAEIHQFAAADEEPAEDTTVEEPTLATLAWAGNEADTQAADDMAEDDTFEEDTAEEDVTEEDLAEGDVAALDEAVSDPQMATFMRAAPDSAEVATDDTDDTAEAASVEEEPATMFADDEADEEDDTPAIDLSELDEGMIDEDVLRDMVADIVRQELTGAMGERITRNVRKLVRREIHRAMVAREFD